MGRSEGRELTSRPEAHRRMRAQRAPHGGEINCYGDVTSSATSTGDTVTAVTAQT